MTTCSITDSWSRSTALPDSRPCVAAAKMRVAPASFTTLAPAQSVPAVSIMSSIRIAARPSTSPIRKRDLGLVVVGALLGEDGQGRAEALGEVVRELRAAGVGRDDDQLLGELALVDALAEVVDEHRQRGHVVDRDPEEALHLAGVQVHGQHAVDAGGVEQVGDQAGRDRLARRRLLVLARVAVPGDDGGDAVRGGELGRVDHDQQLHEAVVHRPAGGLHEEDVGAAHALLEAHVDLAVGEGLEGRRRRGRCRGAPAMRWPRSWLERPANTIRRFESSRSMLVLTAPPSFALPRPAPRGGRLRREPLDHRLARPGDAERAVGDVLGDDRPRPGHRVVADGHGRDEDAVGARLHARADPRAVLAEAVVVGGDVAGADVGALADVGVADVGEVRHLGARADDALLDLDVGAGPRAGPQVGCPGAGRRTGRPDVVGERRAPTRWALTTVQRSPTTVSVMTTSGPMLQPSPTTGRAAQVRAGPQHGVAPDGRPRRQVDGRGSGIVTPGDHQLVAQAALQGGLARGEVDAVVDAGRGLGVVGDARDDGPSSASSASVR